MLISGSAQINKKQKTSVLKFSNTQTTRSWETLNSYRKPYQVENPGKTEKSEF